jgi:hypothetical protein
VSKSKLAHLTGPSLCLPSLGIAHPACPPPLPGAPRPDQGEVVGVGPAGAGRGLGVRETVAPRPLAHLANQGSRRVSA